MPNNENNNINNDFELPNLNNANGGQLPPESKPENKPLIEIPQEYYDKIAAEKEEKARLEAEQAKEQAERKEAQNLLGGIFILIVFNAIVIFALIYSYLNFNELIICAIPAYIIIMAIIQALRKKKESTQPLSIMMGCMAVAIITFLLSATKPKEVDLWSYYAIASAITAFVGLILSSIITNLIADHQNIKALQSVGMLLFIVALIGVPYYLYTKYPEQFYKLVFLKQGEVKAETEEEFIIKTLKNRYDVDFICDDKSIQQNIDQKHRKINQRLCYEANLLNSKKITKEDISKHSKELENNRIIVTSIAYNESENQYIIEDDYIDYVLLRSFKQNIENNLTQTLSANKVLLYLYPEENCSFIGNCADNKDYFANLEKETNPDNQFKNSTQLNLSKYLNMDAKDFVDEYKFKYIITVTSPNFGTEDTYQPAVNRILEQLDKLGLKNTYGYAISLYNVPIENPFPTKVYEIEGETNSNNTFVG